MTEKNSFQGDTNVLDEEFRNESDGVNALDEESRRIEDAVGKPEEKQDPLPENPMLHEEEGKGVLNEESERIEEDIRTLKNDLEHPGASAEAEPAAAAQEPAPQPDASEESGTASGQQEPAETPNSMDEHPDQAEQILNETINSPAPEQNEPQPEAEGGAEAQPEKENLAEADQEGRAEAILEGMLFIVGDEGITAEQAASALDISVERVTELFDQLQKYYTEDSRGIEIANFGGTYRFLSKAFVHPYAQKLLQEVNHTTLSQSALETLAIIAYKQPITRVEIEEIRGVGADMMLRKLEARNLIRESGRSDAPGRPILYEVTDEFMDTFKLLSLAELPELPKFGEAEEESDNLFEK
jgi:segregation and condensation protein B